MVDADACPTGPSLDQIFLAIAPDFVLEDTLRFPVLAPSLPVINHFLGDITLAHLQCTGSTPVSPNIRLYPAYFLCANSAPSPTLPQDTQ
jgi:hypothetical protein